MGMIILLSTTVLNRSAATSGDKNREVFPDRVQPYIHSGYSSRQASMPASLPHHQQDQEAPRARTNVRGITASNGRENGQVSLWEGAAA